MYITLSLQLTATLDRVKSCSKVMNITLSRQLTTALNKIHSFDITLSSVSLKECGTLAMSCSVSCSV